MVSILAALLLAPLPRQSEGDAARDSIAAELARYFGFGPMQIYKLQPGIDELRLADINGDGRTDILVWNGYQSRVEILLQPGPEAATQPAAPTSRETNDLPDRGPMRTVNVPVTQRVASMVVGDVTGDGRNDLILFGEPKELVVIAGAPGGTFAPVVTQRAPDGNPRGGCLCAGDFNGDRRTDVVLLGEEALLLFLQKPEGGLGKPLRLVHGVAQPLMVAAADLDGDGRDDLVIGANDETYGVHVRLQEPNGTLGPQQRVPVPLLRSLTVAKAAGGDEILAVQQSTGRLKRYRWGRLPAGAAAGWPELLYNYPAVSKSKQRPVAVGDVTGDGLADVVAADVDSAQLVLFVQADGRLAPGVAYPGLAKTCDVQIADLDGDGAGEVLSVSAEEKMIGLSRYDEDRLSFPVPYPCEGEPFVVAVGELAPDGPTQVAYVSRADGKLTLHVAPVAAPGRRRDAAARGGDSPEGIVVDVVGLKDDPAALRFADLDQDGRNDLLLFVRFGGAQAYLQTNAGTFEHAGGAQIREAMLKEALPAAFDLVDVTGDGKAEALFAQRNLARAMVVRDGRWTVVDQYNPESADAELTGLAALPGRDRPQPEIVIYDHKAQDLLVFRRGDDAAYRVVETLPVGNFDATAMTSLPLAGSAGLIVADPRRLALYAPGAPTVGLVESASYETPIKGARLADAVPGDFNHDQVRDVALVDVGKAFVEIITTLPSGEFVRATRFQVFQGKRFSDAPAGQREPREILAGDITGDGVDDLVVLTHDRVIVYPSQ